MLNSLMIELPQYMKYLALAIWKNSSKVFPDSVGITPFPLQLSQSTGVE